MTTSDRKSPVPEDTFINHHSKHNGNDSPKDNQEQNRSSSSSDNTTNPGVATPVAPIISEEIQVFLDDGGEEKTTSPSAYAAAVKPDESPEQGDHDLITKDMHQFLDDRDMWDGDMEHVGTKKLDEMLRGPWRDHINAKGDSDMTALHIVARNGLTEAVRVLISAGAEQEVRDESGHTPLHTACLRNQPGVVKALLENGVSIKILTEAENSTLSLAVLSGAEDIVELLLENDRSILQFSEEHSHLNPLHLAAYHRNPEIAEILLANGAKLNIVDEFENTPLMVATDRKVESIMRMLLCPRTEDEDLQLDVPDQYGLTPLMLAASLGYEVGVRVLLDSGADLGAICIKSWDSHESNMRTALDYAILHLQDNIVELILAEEYRFRVSRKAAFAALKLIIEWGTRHMVKSIIHYYASEGMNATSVFKAEIARFDPKGQLFEALMWTAGRSGVYDVGRKLIMERLKLFHHPVGNWNTAQWTTLEWAAYAGLPSVFWLECAASPREESTHRALETSKFIIDKIQAQIDREEDRDASTDHPAHCQQAIYSHGPQRIMLEMIQEVKGILGVHSFGRETGPLYDVPRPIYVDNEPKFTWIHLPSTNDLLQRIMYDMESDASQFYQVKSFFRDSWVEVPDKISASRMMRPRFVETVQENETPASAVYMPYLSYATQCREEEGEEPFSPTPDVEDDPKNVLQALRAEKYKYEQLLSTYKPGVIHGSSTLDEWYYHFASDQEASKDRKARNESQVVTKGLPGKIEDKDFWPLIRVNQLWIWTIADTDTFSEWLITASSHPMDGKKNVLLEGVVDHLTKQTESGGSRSLPGSTAEMSRLIIDFCISSYETLPKASRKSSSTTLGVNGTAEEPALQSPTWQFAPNPQSSVEYPPELLSMRQMFSNSINKIGIDEANLFAKFSSEAGEILATMNDENEIKEFQVALGIKKPGVESCQAVIDDKSTRTDTDNELERKRQARIKNNLVAIRKAEDLSSRIKDIRDELNILKAVAQYQRDVQREMQKLPGSQEAGLSASHVVNDIKEMDKVADRIQTSVNNTLSLQQTTVSLEMSMAANDQSKLSMKQGKTLMVFTVVTILFLPLSFLTSLFAIDANSFMEALGWIFVVIFSVSIAFFIPLAGYAIYSDQVVQHLSAAFRKAIRNTSDSESSKSAIPKRSLPSSEQISRSGHDGTILELQYPPLQREPSLIRNFRRQESGEIGSDGSSSWGLRGEDSWPSNQERRDPDLLSRSWKRSEGKHVESRGLYTV
ncbi:hypothetical protein BDP67DRAFT_566638 [Colletotrichum lupini]|nr:hypothetical protein BDP67DRAFT_566638 [Colletotrichum lupini]